MRIPLRPGVKLSLFEPQNQDAVSIRMATYYNPLHVLRLISKRGWMVLLVRYDWRDKGVYEPLDRADVPLTAEEAVRALHHPVTLEGMACCDECSTARSTGPQTSERIAYIPHPCRTIRALDGETT